MAVKKCPKNWVRLGCCICRPSCNFEMTDFFDETVDFGLYCKKLPSYSSKVYKSQKECTKNSTLPCEDYAGRIWTESCKNYYQRIGANRCTYTCPSFWTDIGNACKPVKIINGGYPFPWMVGDTKGGEVHKEKKNIWYDD